MATRQQQAASADRKAARAEALRVLGSDPLPLPAEPHTSPAEPSDELPAEIVALGEHGLTDTQIAHHLCLSQEQLQAMENGHSAIKAALSRARTAAKAWWEEQARRALITENNRFPAGAWAQVMKARFKDYDDKPQFVFDIGSLVVINRRQPPEPLHERVADSDKPLIEGRTVRLAHSPTASDEAEGSREATHDAASDG